MYGAIIQQLSNQKISKHYILFHPLIIRTLASDALGHSRRSHFRHEANLRDFAQTATIRAAAFRMVAVWAKSREYRGSWLYTVESGAVANMAVTFGTPGTVVRSYEPQHMSSYLPQILQQLENEFAQSKPETRWSNNGKTVQL